MTRGNLVLPSADTETPDVPVDGYLTPDDFGIPRKRCFTPGELAPYFLVSARTIERMIEEERIRAIPVGSSWKIPYAEVVRYFLRQRGLFN